MKFSPALSRVLFFGFFSILCTSFGSLYGKKQVKSNDSNLMPEGGRQNSGIGYLLGFFIKDNVAAEHNFAEKSIPVSGISKINFIIDSSTIYMRSCLEKRDEILIKYKQFDGNGQVDFSETDGSLIIKSKDPNNTSPYGFSVDYEVYAPIGTNVKINAKSVNINIEDMNVEEVKSGFASLTIKNNMAKKVDINYGSGNAHFLYNALPIEEQNIKIDSGTGDVSFILPSASRVNWYSHAPLGRVRSDFDKIRDPSTRNFNIHFHAGFGNLFINKNGEQNTTVNKIQYT